MSSTERVIRVIETVVARQHTGIRFAEIVTGTGVAKATVHRILAELVGLGLLTFSPDSKRYRAALKLASLGAGVISNFELRNYVHPHWSSCTRKPSTPATSGSAKGMSGSTPTRSNPTTTGSSCSPKSARPSPCTAPRSGKC
jgi:hypothetical protein